MHHGQRRSLTSGGPTQNFVASVVVVVVVGGGWDERMDVTNAFARVSLRLELRSRNSISSTARHAFNTFFCLEQETV